MDNSTGLFCGNSYIYWEGNWAEIIDQTPDIEINGYKAEFYEDYVKFGCAKIHKNHIRSINDDLRAYITKPLKKGYKVMQGVKIGKGVFTLDQINQIAQYYEKQ